MPRKTIMNWEGNPAYRWVKMYKGKRYRVSCDELHAPRTKEESYQAANDWWFRKQGQLMIANRTPKQAEQLAELAIKLDYARNHAPELVAGLEETERQLTKQINASPIDPIQDEIILDDEEVIAENLKVFQLLGGSVPDNFDPMFLQQVFGNRRLWGDRLRNHQKTEENKTIGFQIDRFLQANQHRWKPGTFKGVRRDLDSTLGTPVWSKDTSIESINRETINRYKNWLDQKNYCTAKHNNHVGRFRQFMRWLEEQELIAGLPKNLRSKTLMKTITHKEIKTFDNVCQTLDTLPPEQRIWALLGLNCGMTNADLGAANWEMIDQTRWTLTRRRVKTGDKVSVPTVTYELWAETIEALKALPHRTGLLFTKPDGTPIYINEYRNGKPHIWDGFGHVWRNLAQKPAIPLKSFRSIGATMFKRSATYRDYRHLFLGHAATTLADRHYSAESDNPFFEALRFVGDQIFG